METVTSMQVPAGLAAKAVSEGINRVEFGGTEPPEGTRFEVWRRHGDTVDWYLHSTVDGAPFEDSQVKPGQYYEYKVRSVNGDAASEFTETVVVYGK